MDLIIIFFGFFDKKIGFGILSEAMSPKITSEVEYSSISILRILTMHTLAIACAWHFGASGFALLYAAIAYYLRHFAIAAFFHRYFSHRSFKTSRVFQFLMAFIATMGGQKGPLSWGTSHRLHHQHTEKPGDPHSPKVLGFGEAYIGWLLRKNALHTDLALMKDFAVFPEIVWLNKHHYVGPLAFLGFTAVVGYFVETKWPSLHTSQIQLIVWGVLIATLLNAHSAMIVNTVCHLFGRTPYKTRDDSKNVWWLWPLSTGENWHNNHHAFPKMAASGLTWYEWDPIYWGICGLAKLGLVWDVVDKSYLEKFQQVQKSQTASQESDLHAPTLHKLEVRA